MVLYKYSSFSLMRRWMLPIVNDRVAWSVGLSPSEPCRKFGSNRDTVYVQGSGGPR